MSPRRPVVRVVAAAVAAAVVTACGTTDSSKSGARSDGAGPRTLRWDVPAPGRPGIDGNFQPIFHGRTPFLPGDSYIVWNNLPGGSHEHIFCVIARQTPRRTFWCTRTYVTRSGQIVAAGDEQPTGTLPVVGGTGAFAGARGTATDQLGRHGGPITIRVR